MVNPASSPIVPINVQAQLPLSSTKKDDTDTSKKPPVDSDIKLFYGFIKFLKDNRGMHTSYLYLPLLEYIPHDIGGDIQKCIQKKPEAFANFTEAFANLFRDEPSSSLAKNQLPQNKDPIGRLLFQNTSLTKTQLRLKIEHCLYLAVGSFKVSKDPYFLIEFLKKSIEIIEKNDLQYGFNFKWLIKLLETKNLPLLNQSCYELAKAKQPTDIIAGADCYEFVAVNLACLFDTEDVCHDRLQEKLELELIHQLAIPEVALNLSQGFTQEELACLQQAYASLHLTSLKQFEEFRGFFLPLQRYVKEVCLSKVNYFKHFSDLKGEVTENMKNQVKLKIKQHVPFLKSYMSFANEISRYFDPPKELINNYVVLKNFHAYLQFGNCETLRQKLNQKNGISLEQLKKAIIEEVTIFFQQLPQDSTLSAKVALFSTENPQVNQCRVYWSHHQQYFAHLTYLKIALLREIIPLTQLRSEIILNCIQQEEELAQQALDKLLQEEAIAQQAQNNFSIDTKQKKTKNQKKGKNPKKGNRGASAQKLLPVNSSLSSNINTAQAKTPLNLSTQQAKDGNSQSSSSSQKLPSQNNLVAQAQPAALTPFQQLLMTRTHANTSLQSLKGQCTAFGVQEALDCAQSHYDELLCIMRRFLEQPKKFSKQMISVFLTQWIQHGFLATEQILTAMGDQEKQIQNRAELLPVLSHNLSNLLLNCPLKTGAIPLELRDWIWHTRLGEIWIREEQNYYNGNTSLQNLLANIKQFVNGSSPFKAQKLIKDVLYFMSNAVKLYENLHMQSISLKPPLSISPAQEFKKHFLESCQRVEIAIESLPEELNQALPFESPLIHLREMLEKYRANSASPIVRYGLTDVLENLLPTLEMEMQAQGFLNPFEARLHLRTVLRYNQWAMEKILRTLLNEFYPEANFEKKDHNLSEMVLILGMKQQDFTHQEWYWLTSGQTIHHLVRYFTNHQATQQKRQSDFIKRLEDAFVAAHQITIKQPIDADYALNQGFQITGETLTKLNMVKAVASEDTQLMQSILSKVLEHSLPKK